MYAYAMSPSEVVCGSRTSTGTILTIPAGRQWCGSIMISASVAVAGAGTPNVTISGTNASPASGSVVHRLSLSGLALTTVAAAATIDLIAFAPDENDVTLEFATGGATSASVVCNGFIV